MLLTLILNLGTAAGIVVPVPPSVGHPAQTGNGISTLKGGRLKDIDTYEISTLEERKKRIQRDEQEWMLFIKIFIEQCQ